MSSFSSTPCEKVYLFDQHLLETNTAVASFVRVEGSKHGSHSFKLEKTIFHPQGGGQPSDVGIIKWGEISFNVNFVQCCPDGSIDHIGVFTDTASSALESDQTAASAEAISVMQGTEVTLLVDKGTRSLYSRIHSAGHALDPVLERCGLLDKLIAVKGYHFLDGPYVEYDLIAGASLGSAEEVSALPARLTEAMGRIIEESIPTTVASLEREEAGQLCKCDATGYPDVVRVVTVAGFPCPCGGTHVDNTSELGRVTITKMKIKKQRLRISYTLEG